MASLPRPFGRYILEQRIAMGGMAEIFRDTYAPPFEVLRVDDLQAPAAPLELTGEEA